MRKVLFLPTILIMAILILNPLFSEDNMSFTITSPNFENMGEIPAKYTCEGKNISPELSWGNLPKGTMSLALISDDPDAPDPNAPQMTWVHWVIYNISTNATGLKEGILSADLPNGAIQGINDSKNIGYGGPCPPIGRHRDFFKLYALDSVLDNMVQPVKKSQLKEAMKGHIIEETQLIGTYKKN